VFAQLQDFKKGRLKDRHDISWRLPDMISLKLNFPIPILVSLKLPLNNDRDWLVLVDGLCDLDQFVFIRSYEHE
jgi:hypothetical protein